MPKHSSGANAPSLPETSRRALLGRASALGALALVGSAAPVGAAVDVTAEAHPDKALLAAWAGYVKAQRAFEYACDVLLPNGGTDADHEPYYQAIDFYGDQIERHQASTVEGFAVQLRYLFAKKMGCMASYQAAIYGEPVSDELAATLAADDLDKMLWGMAQAATRASRA
ncbi:hypothetical protein [Aquabacter spiritensis]|uniref:Secreted protein n=1 Tax=Aquabacter spiritensis TaxID=933073 RepID=A0A4R3M4Q7_9HYPH|nr:hypothetical protein [Aquabacter spiritensis]TCT08301.1 hypothetical protein EDC64_101825 [Aquabacter spiritensis]